MLKVRDRRQEGISRAREQQKEDKGQVTGHWHGDGHFVPGHRESDKLKANTALWCKKPSLPT